MAAEMTYQFDRLSEVRNQPLSWVQVKGWKARYELRAGSHLIAVMDWDGIFRTTATVHSAEGSWHLARRGFFRLHTDVELNEQDDPVLKLDHNMWSGGSLTLPDGRALRWRGTNFWGTKYAFIDEAADRALISYQFHGLFKYNAEITIDPQAESLPYLVMLLSLGWYLIILQMMDSAAIASTG